MSSTIYGVPQYDPQNWTVVPCCGSAFNKTEFIDFLRAHKFSLADDEIPPSQATAKEPAEEIAGL